MPVGAGKASSGMDVDAPSGGVVSELDTATWTLKLGNDCYYTADTLVQFTV